MKRIEEAFYQILEGHAAQSPDRDAVVMGDERITYRELLNRIDGVSSLLLREGLQRGDKVALWGDASPAWLYTYFGIIRAGGVAVILNSRLTPADARPLMEFADCVFLCFGATHDYAGTSADAQALSDFLGIPASRAISIVDTDFSRIPLVVVDDAGRTSKDDSYIIFTSGTTSFPKGVVSSQYALINTMEQCTRAIASLRGDRALVGVPLFHAYGLCACWLYLYHGGTLILPNSIKANVIAEAAAKEDVTDLWSVGPIYQGIIDDEALAAKVASKLRLCTIAGSYTAPVQFMRFEASLPRTTFLNMFGMTECGAVFISTRPEDDLYTRYNTVGSAFEGIEVAVWDEEKGILPPGETGEIITRGFHLKNSYYKFPPEKQAVDEDGWLHTGDLGVLNEQGNLQIVGRIKDLIIKGGENIAPAEIEKVVMEHPDISGCGIFGFHDRFYGENLSACVTVTPGHAFDENALREYMKEKVGSYKSPAQYFVYDAFQLNANRKVDRLRLHTDMLTRLHRRILDQKLSAGICIVNLSIKNSTYNITPVAAMMEECAVNLGFDRRRAARVHGAVEEILLMRVNEAEDIGDISIQLQYTRSFLRIIVTDPDLEVDPARTEERKLSARLLLKLVDDLSWKVLPDGKYEVRIDFSYEKDFDIKGFLLKHQKLS